MKTATDIKTKKQDIFKVQKPKKDLKNNQNITLKLKTLMPLSENC